MEGDFTPDFFRSQGRSEMRNTGMDEEQLRQIVREEVQRAVGALALALDPLRKHSLIAVEWMEHLDRMHKVGSSTS